MEREDVLVAIVAATRYELRSLRPFLRVSTRALPGRARYERGLLDGVEVAAAAVGLGPENAAKGIARFLEAVRPRFLLGIGLAGALDPELALGDVVLAEEIWELQGAPALGAPLQARLVFKAEPQLLEAAIEAPLAKQPATAVPRYASMPPRAGPLEIGRRHWFLTLPPPRVQRGRIVTSPSVVSLPEEKWALGRALGAFAVDMESSILAEAAVSRGIPFLAARAILDEACEEVPPELARSIGPEGRASALRLFAQVLRRPKLLKTLVSLPFNCQAAFGSLRFYVRRLVRELERRSEVQSP